MIEVQELAPSPLGEGCQWVIEPVSRHFFINQLYVDFLFFSKLYFKYIIKVRYKANFILYNFN